MPRDTARKLEQSPNLSHVNVRRNDQGVAQMSTVTTGVSISTTGTTTISTTVTTLTDPVWVNFTSAQITANGAGAGSAATAQLTRNGTATVLSTSATGTSTTNQTGQTHTTPLNAPVYNLVLTANGGSATATLTSLSRDSKWV